MTKSIRFGIGAVAVAIVAIMASRFARPNLPIVQMLTTKRFTKGRPNGIRQIVLHTAGVDEMRGKARALAAELADVTTWDRDASWHYAIDDREIVQSVLDSDTAWHANQVNDWSIGIELIGHEQSAADWQDPYSKAELELAARLVASLCLKYGIPIRRVTSEQLQADPHTPGILGHVDVAMAAGSDARTDPGVNFPWPSFMARVLSIYRGEG